MRKIAAAILISILTSVGSGGSFAITPNTVTAPPGNWYAEGYVGNATINKSYSASARKSGAAWGMDIGYLFFPYLGAEIGFSRYPNVNLSSNGLEAQDTHYSYDVAAKAVLPVPESGFSVFAKLGAGRLNSNVTNSSNNTVNITNPDLKTANYYATSYFLGAGAQYNFLPNFGLNLQWTRATGDNQTGSVDMYAIGAAVRFG